MRPAALLILILLAGCSDKSIQDNQSREIANLQEQLKAARSDLASIRAQHSPSPVKRSEPKAPIAEEPKKQAVAMCWQDYCPCDEAGAVDRMLCRNLKGGLAVSDEEMASGAAQRDGRKAMRDWIRENPSLEQ